MLAPEHVISNMRTSPRQYKLMVQFMEKHGDLSKPSTDNGAVTGRMACMQHWAELTKILNSDRSGQAKTANRWKKVWSDFKANTKKKAARISQKETRSVLSELEERVLNIKDQTVTITAEILEFPKFCLEQTQAQKELQMEQFHKKFSEFQVIHVEEAQSEEDHNGQIHVGKVHNEMIDTEEIQNEEICMEEVQNEEVHNEEIHVEEVNNKEVYVKHIQKELPANNKPKPANLSSDSQSGSEHYLDDWDQQESIKPPEKKPKPNLKRPLRSSYHNRTMHSQTETPRRTREQEWLSFQKEIERERVRIRKRELQHQGRWLDLFEQFLELGNRVVDVMERRHF